MLKLLYVFLLLFIFIPAYAADELSVTEAKEKLKQTFNYLNVSKFSEGPLPGTYELITGNKVIYFHPENELLIFGEIYNKQGRSLTAESRNAHQQEKLSDLDLNVALAVGNGEKKIIEFTDPDCPYCRKLDSYLSDKTNVTRLIYFSIPKQMHPKADAKAVHVFCSNNPQQALNDVFANSVEEEALLDCEVGRAQLTEHKRISDDFGVTGTPTVVLDNSVVTGFRQAQIARYLE